MGEWIGAGPFYEVESAAYTEMYERWAARTDARSRSRARFAADLNAALSEGRRLKGTQARDVTALLESGRARPVDPRDGGRRTLKQKVGALREERSARKGPAAPSDRLGDLVATETGWAAWLKSLSEHPGMSPRNLASIARWRLEHGDEDLSCLLSKKQVDERGGRVRPGSVGIPINQPKTEEDADGRRMSTGFERVSKFPPSAIEGIEVRGRRTRIDPDSAEQMDAFLAAASRVDLDSLDSAAEAAVSMRYGLDDPDDMLPPLPGGESPTARELEAELRRVSERAGAVCKRIDIALAQGRARVQYVPAPDRCGDAAAGADEPEEREQGAPATQAEADAPAPAARPDAPDPATMTTASLMRLLKEAARPEPGQKLDTGRSK